MDNSFEKAIQSNNSTVAVAIYGGPAITFDAMNKYMQNMFLQQMFDKNIRDFEAYISQHPEPSDWYIQYAHLFSLAIPVYISIVQDGEITYSASVIRIQNTVSDIINVLKGNRLYMYSERDTFCFNRYLKMQKAMGNILDGNHFETKSYISECLYASYYPTLDEHICALNLPLGEYISSPHYCYVNAPGRLKESADAKALSFWKIVNNKL